MWKRYLKYKVKEINTIVTKKQNLFRQLEQIYFNTCVKFENYPAMFVELSLNKRLNKGIWWLWAFFIVSTVIKQCFFHYGVYQEFGGKVMEIKVAEINVPLN